jgi:hypothetical protein
MTITGGIKFFERSSALYKDGATATATTNSASARNILTNRQLVYWQSEGSDDTTTETITVTFPNEVTVDRVFLNRINFKEFTVRYFASTIWNQFSNVVGLDGTLPSGIAETDFSYETAYYEVDSVATTGIEITATKTQTADQEKMMYNLFTTVELGTLELPPQISPLGFSRNARTSTGMQGLSNVQKGYETLALSLGFKNHGSQSDLDLLTTLYNRDKSFLVWICGGRAGSPYFTYESKGYGLRDIFNMQTPAGTSPEYPNSIYLNAPNNTLPLVSSI